MKKLLTKKALLIGLSFMALTSYAQLSIDHCQQKARENFPLIKQYGLIEQTLEYTISNANKAYLPQLDVTLIGGVLDGMPSFGAPETESSGADMQMISLLQVNQVIWDGGATKAKKKSIEANSDMAKANIDVSLYALQDRVNHLFFGILLIDEQLKQLDILKSTLERKHQRVKTALENGTAYQSDLDEIFVEILLLDQKRKDLSFNRTAYLNVLSGMLGEELNQDIKLDPPKAIEVDFSKPMQRPELTVFKSQREILSAQLGLNKAMLYPKIGMMGFGTFIQPGVAFGSSSLENIMVGGVSLKWSLGQMYKNANNKKLVTLDYDRIAIQEETFLFNISLEERQLKVELNRNKSQIEKDLEVVTLKKRIQAAYEKKYQNGTCTMAQWLDRVNDESAANQTLAGHQMHYLLKLYEYQILSGQQNLKND